MRAADTSAPGDDDDLYDPQRLELQMQALVDKRTPLALLLNWLVWWPEAGRLAVMSGTAFVPSLVCEKTELSAYPDLSLGEDVPVVDELLSRFEPAWAVMPQLYVYVVTAGTPARTSISSESFGPGPRSGMSAHPTGGIGDIGWRLPLAAYVKALRAWRGPLPPSPPSERSKMLAGEWYTDSPELLADRIWAQRQLAR